MSDVSALVVAGVLKRLSESEDMPKEMRNISEELQEGFDRYMAGVASPLTYGDIMAGKFIGGDKPPVNKLPWYRKWR